MSNQHIKIHICADDEQPSESFVEAYERMAKSFVAGIRDEAAFKAVFEAASANAVQERPRPWWAVWRIGQWWDKRESARAHFQRTCHWAAAKLFEAAATAASQYCGIVAGDPVATDQAGNIKSAYDTGDRFLGVAESVAPDGNVTVRIGGGGTPN